MKFFFLACFFVISAKAAEPPKNNDTVIEDLEARVIDLEQRQKEMSDWYNNFYLLGKGRVVPYLNENISLGGFFESAVTHIYGPDTETQTSGNSHILGINLTAQFNDKMLFATQALTLLSIPLRNIHNNPNLTPSERQFKGASINSTVAQGYFEYRSNEYFNVQTGIGYAPYGIIYQQREPELFRLRGGSQILTSDDGDTVGIASPLWMGLHFYGFLPFSPSVGYNIYSMTPKNAVSTLGVGARLWKKISEYATFGISAQSGEQNDGNFFAHGFDLDLKYKKFGFVSEYGRTSNSGDTPDTEFYYFEPYYKFVEDEWLVFLNAEYVDHLARTDLLTHIPDPVKKWQYAIGFNWLPLPNVRFRLTYLNHDYIDELDAATEPERDYEAIDFSTAIAF